MKTKRLTKNQMKALKFRSPGLQESSVITYGYAVRSYFNYLIDNNLDEQFNIDNIKAWLKTHRNASTYNIRLQGIKEFYYKQFENRPAVHRLKMREAFETIKRMRPVQAKLPEISYLEYNQVLNLIDLASARISCIISALFWTGCRVSELINIRLRDIKESHHISMRVLGKGYKERWVYLPKSEYKRIRRTFKDSKVYLFETLQGRQYNRKVITEEISRQSMLKLGIKVHAHTLRHSKAMYLKSRGLSPDQIARALGHANVTVTLAYYLHGTPSASEQGLIR